MEVLVRRALSELARESGAPRICEKNVECRTDRPPGCKRALGAIDLLGGEHPGEPVPQCDLAVCAR